ncbi:hypothetical protein ES705_21354 [subsurface metagenome]
MVDKTFIVTHARARASLTITGKTIEEALEREGLDPNIWKPVGQPEEAEEEASGDNQGDDIREDN